LPERAPPSASTLRHSIGGEAVLMRSTSHARARGAIGAALSGDDERSWKRTFI
jgi:hypothetical protein